MSKPIRDSRGRFISPSATARRETTESLALEVAAQSKKKSLIGGLLSRVFGLGGSNGAHQKA